MKKLPALPIFVLILIFLALNSCKPDTNEVERFNWQTFRGVNVGQNLCKQDIADLTRWNANLVRLSLAVDPLMDLDPPYALNKKTFDYVDSVISWCEEYDIAVILDPHKYPGTMHRWTMLGNDPFWKDFKYHDLVIALWDTISLRYKDKGSVIAAYDLLNEPEVKPDMKKGSPEDINLLYTKLIETIRKNDRVHTISLALPRYSENGKMQAYHEGIRFIDIPEDDNIILQSHTYMPQPFTHQNVWEDGEFIPYPSEIDGEYWDYERLKEVQSELIEFSTQNPHIPILIGEFSCPRWTGQDCIQYLDDVIRIAEENNWSWAYHGYRESHIWDAEISPASRADSLNKVSSTPRMELLKSYFARNTNTADLTCD